MSSEDFRILIVDDEPNIRSGLKRGLASESEEITTAENAAAAMAAFDAEPFQLVIADIRLGGDMDGIELLKLFKASRPEVAVIVITAHGTVETAVDAMRAGAFDFIVKPLDLQLIREQVIKARKHCRLLAENQRLRTSLASAGQISSIIGNSAVMQTVFQQIRQVAATEATVMIHGESGTGKELVARALHDLSERSNQPFVAMNLGALPESLLESELFGHEKGAFTGAARTKPGCFEQAGGGTLFLDEVTEMSVKSQIDLLRVLESRLFTRVGGEETLQSNARIVSATNRCIDDLIADGSFREDLFYRLNVVPIEIPPLRERKADIPLLVEHFLEFYCQRHRRSGKHFTTAAMHTLISAPWPGNVRQLRNVIERLVVTHVGDSIDNADLPADLRPQAVTPTAATGSLADVVERAERNAIKAALIACDMHRERTARALGISVRSLHYKMSRYDLH